MKIYRLSLLVTSCTDIQYSVIAVELWFKDI